MDFAQTSPSELDRSCQRRLGRADVVLDAVMATPSGRGRCTISDLSLDGARLVTNQSVETGQNLWLTIEKLKIFATVQWSRPGAIGVCFEQKLPKAFVLELLGEPVDREAYQEAEAMLAAKNWVMGDQAPRSSSLSLADLVKVRNSKDVGSNYLAGGLKWILQNDQGPDRARRRVNKKVVALFATAGIVGSLAGLGSSLLF